MIVAWGIWYLFNSFRSPLPWKGDAAAALAFFEDNTLRCRSGGQDVCSWEGVTEWPQTPGISAPGGVVGHLALTLFLGWLLVWLCVCKGRRSPDQ